MSKSPDLIFSDRWILSSRGNKNTVDLHRPYACLVEKERTATGKIENVATIFLTNRECPFHCLMCDLWKNTTNVSVPPGAIPDQIEWALNKLPDAIHLKLYNSGSFFDQKAISLKDYRKIAAMVSHFETVIVESHPYFINERCLSFMQLLKPELQVAIGLETVQPEILRKLNKRMTLKNFTDAVRFLSLHEILSRAFILLRPPFLSESEGIYWAERSLDYAFESGVECCSVIPVRPGNGAMEKLMGLGYFSIPDIRSLEKVIEYGISLKKGRVFADVWDINLFSLCGNCIEERRERLIRMNLTQEIPEHVKCSFCQD